MGKTILALGTIALGLVSCSAPNGPAFSRCAALSYTKPAIDEQALLLDLRQLVETPGVALVADYRDGGSTYLTVYMTPGQDFAVREKVSVLGWQRIDSVPSTAKPGSRIFGTSF